MTSSIPDSISPKMLQELHDEKSTECQDCIDKSQIVMDAVDSVAQKIESIGAYLKTADYSIWVLIQYHKAGYDRFKEQGHVEQAAAWYSDLQRLEELRDTLNTIEVECPDHE
jgi:hypothetical protein